MDKSVLNSIMRTAEGNINAFARRGNIDSARASTINQMMGNVMQELNDNGTLEKIPAQVREHYIAETIQKVAVESLASGKTMDEVTLKSTMEAEIASSKAAQLAAERKAQLGGSTYSVVQMAEGLLENPASTALKVAMAAALTKGW